ncbi:hypothetical protein GN958_ATG17714 [Phytophthora infestans]|uniref:Uncharacterized protein n=1 Tax=Phytophthora infestans TaxID=4787 RepID=A0A8S9U1A0_PHYIN|nr:hypothetical protein GN958_ATG17714 [Phytophthora infestans]
MPTFATIYPSTKPQADARKHMPSEDESYDVSECNAESSGALSQPDSDELSNEDGINRSDIGISETHFKDFK